MKNERELLMLFYDSNNFREVQELNADHRIAIYWKESIRQMAADLLGRDLSTLPNAVGKDWSFFK